MSTTYQSLTSWEQDYATHWAAEPSPLLNEQYWRGIDTSTVLLKHHPGRPAQRHWMAENRLIGWDEREGY